MIALYLFGALLLVLLVGVVLAPLLTGGGDVAAELEDLPRETRREVARDAMRELEFERETGKVSEREYRRLRAHYAGIADAAGPDEGRCAACGAALEPGDRFCPRCGSPRSAEASRSDAPSAPGAEGAPGEPGSSS